MSNLETVFARGSSTGFDDTEAMLDSALPAYEQYLLELTNDRRLEAGAPPLAWSGEIAAVSGVYVRRISETGRFSHTDESGATPSMRLRKAGFTFRGQWAVGENLAWKAASAPEGTTYDVRKLDRALAESPSHLRNMLDPRFRQGGVGLVRAAFQDQTAVIAAMNFVLSGDQVFLTGVAYDDRNRNGRFDPGEQKGGLAIRASSDDGRTARTQTREGGGYDLPVSDGVWTIEAEDADGRTTRTRMLVAGENVKADLLVETDSGADAACVTSLRFRVLRPSGRFQTAEAPIEAVTVVDPAPALTLAASIPAAAVLSTLP